MTRSRITRLLRSALLGGVLLLAACGFPQDSQATPIPEDELPVGLRSDPTATTVPDSTEPATIWFVSNDRLVRVLHDVESPASVTTVTNELLIGPSTAEQDRGLRSGIPDSTVVVGAELIRGTAQVQLAPSFAEISPEDQILAVGQLVLTLTNLPGIGGVQFSLDGAPVAVPLPSGKSSDQTVFRDDFIVLADIDEGV